MKAFLKQLWKMPLLTLVYAVLMALVNGLLPLDPAISDRLSPDDTKTAGVVLLLDSFVLAGLTTLLIQRLRLSGLKLYAAVFSVTWGLMTFMTQIETGIFIKAFPLLTQAELLKFFLRHFLVLAAFVPLAMLLQGGWKKDDERKAAPLAAGWQWKAALLTALYAALYFSFGLYPWAFAEVRQFYASWSGQNNQPVLALIQVFRGGLWLVCALPVFLYDRGPKGRTVVFLALLYAVLPSFQLFFPNGLMPQGVRMAHFVEVFSEMAVFGAAAGMLLLPAGKKAVQ